MPKLPPAVSALAQAMAESSDLRIVHLEDIGPHYATTLAHYLDLLAGAGIDPQRLAQEAALRALTLSPAARTTWDFSKPWRTRMGRVT